MSAGSTSLFDMVAVVAMVAIVAVVLLVLLMRRAATRAYEPARALLSPPEAALFAALRQACGDDYDVHPKVRLADIIGVRKGLTRKQRSQAQDEIAQRSVGFVLCEPGSQAIRGVVELDDSKRHRASRHAPVPFLDTALAAAHVPLLRVAAQESYAAGELRDRVLTVLRASPEAAPAPRGRLERLMAAAVPVDGEPVKPASGVVAGGRKAKKRWILLEDPGSAAAWLPTRGVLTVAAVILVIGTVLSWFLEPAERPPPTPKPATTPRPGAVEPATTAPAPLRAPQGAPEKEPEIVGYRDVRVPGKPLDECMGPDREINPAVLRCRDGYTRREPIYR